MVSDRTDGEARASSDSPPDWITSIFRPAKLAKLALVVGLVTLLPYLTQRLPNLSARAEYRLSARQIRLVPEPHGPVPQNLLEQICDRERLPQELSVLDTNLVVTLGEAFSRNPWIEKVISVRKSYPAQVAVEVRYRQPVGMVQVKGGRIPIDARGVILPAGDFTAADLNRYPMIQGVNSSETLRIGRPWKNPSLLAAARLAQLLAPKWNELHLQSIYVTGRTATVGDESSVVLELRAVGGSKVIWGREPGSEHPGELTASQKVGRLEKYLSEFGGFDRPNGPYEIDIRHWQEISRRPLVSDQASSRTGSSRVRK